MDLGYGYHHRIGCLEAACHHRLYGADDGGATGHRVQTVMRHAGVTATSLDRNVEFIGRSHQRTGPAAQNAKRGVGHDVNGKGCIGKRVDQAIVQHKASAMMPLFTGLEHEIHRA